MKSILRSTKLLHHPLFHHLAPESQISTENWLWVITYDASVWLKPHHILFSSMFYVIKSFHQYIIVLAGQAWDTFRKTAVSFPTIYKICKLQDRPETFQILGSILLLRMRKNFPVGNADTLTVKYLFFYYFPKGRVQKPQ